MEKINWKKEFKRLGMNLADELYLGACTIFIAAIIFHFHPEKSMQILEWMCDIKYFSISIMFLTGIALWATILRLILTKIFYFLLFITRFNKNN